MSLTVEEAEHSEPRRRLQLPPALSWPRLVIGLIVGLAVATAVVLIFSPHLVADLHDVRLATEQPAYLVLVLVCVFIYMTADAETLVQLVRVFTPSSSRVPLYLVTLRGTAIGGATSFGGIEIPYLMFALRRHVASLSESTSIVIVKGVVRTSLLVVVAALALIPMKDSPITPLQRWLVLGACGVILLGWIVGSVWVRRPVGLSRLPERLRRHVYAFRDALAQFHGVGWRAVVRIILLQIIYWSAMFAIIPLTLHALGWRGSLLPIITSQAVLQVLMPLSPLPGGAGVAELGYLALIGSSMDSTTAVASLVLWRAATWGIPMVLGIVAFAIRDRHEAGAGEAYAARYRATRG